MRQNTWVLKLMWLWNKLKFICEEIVNIFYNIEVYLSTTLGYFTYYLDIQKEVVWIKREHNDFPIQIQYILIVIVFNVSKSLETNDFKRYRLIECNKYAESMTMPTKSNFVHTQKEFQSTFQWIALNLSS